MRRTLLRLLGSALGMLAWLLVLRKSLLGPLGSPLRSLLRFGGNGGHGCGRGFGRLLR